MPGADRQPEPRRLARRDVLALGATTVGCALAGAGLIAVRWLSRDEVARATTDALPPSSDDTGSLLASKPDVSSIDNTTTTTTASAVITRPSICRGAWGALPAKPEPRSHTIERLTIHHSAVALTDNRKAPARLRADQQFHLSKGFTDIAYHYGIDAHGNIYEARRVDTPGESFTDYDTTGHFLVVLEGNFEEQVVPEGQLAALVDLLAWASTKFSVSPTTIAGHNAYAATKCPGVNLRSLLDNGSVRQQVEQRLGDGGVALKPVCGNEASALVARIEGGTD